MAAILKGIATLCLWCREFLWRIFKGRTVGDAGTGDDKAAISVALFDRGLTQVLQASVTGLEPKKPYVIALAHERNGEGPLEPLAAFMTNPAGSAIVNADGAIRRVVHGEARIKRRYLGIAEGHHEKPGPVVQLKLVQVQLK
ncbi:hypothetical protein [Bradyrhizobium sp. URHD0069]|uniref:hypothetical protein n=1 Tax=Bradyrhizobium sp. URHD0069 TaxID=1380355 RepID=UPI000ACEA345